jgi:hypothetical protein
MTMFSEERLFENFFNDRRIINRRMYDFSFDSLNRLTAANGGGDYTTLITLITPLIVTFGTEIGEVDVALTIQLGKTMTNDQAKAAFGLTMKEKQGVIASALGGFTAPEYLEFYPSGLMEYTEARKSQMPMLTSRVKVAATANSVALGAPLTTLLQSFETLWTNSRTDQEAQKGVVDDNRTERSGARVALELGMLTTVHTIAAKFPGDIDACNNFFAFRMLFPHGHKKTQTFVGDLVPDGGRGIVNATFTDSMVIDIHNPDDNADIIVAIVHTKDSKPGPLAKRVKPHKSLRVKPSELGDITNDTWLVVYNASDVNDGSYLVKVKGLVVEEEE